VSPRAEDTHTAARRIDRHETEEITDNLLTQIARELMSEARTGTTKAPKRVDVTQE
jgi:hypothetical protein